MGDLKTTLTAEGIDVSSFKTLREVAVEGDDYLAGLPETELERQYPIYTLTTRREDVISLREKLRTVLAKLRHFPVIVGDKESVGLLWESREYAEFPDEYLNKAQFCNANGWLNERWRGILAYANKEIIDPHVENHVEPFTGFDISDFDYFLQEPMQHIGFIPTGVSWEIPAYLAFGGFNDSPNPEEHVCIQQYWYSLYDTEIVAMTHDQIICHVKSPVSTEEAALNLAREQMAYCDDSVYQGAGTLSVLAGRLLNGTYWYFWWD